MGQVGGSPVGWFTSDQFPEIDRIVRIAMTISIVIGVGAVALGLRLTRTKRGSNGGSWKKTADDGR